MVFKHFSIQVGLRVTLLTLVLVAWTMLFVVPGYPILRLLLTAIALLQIYNIFRFVTRTNAALARFLEAVRYADFGQRFDMRRKGAGFEELGGVLTDIVERFQAERAQQEEDLRHLRALTEHVPVPLLSLHPDGKVQLHNNAARRLFGSTRIARLEDFNRFGEDFSKQVFAVAAGERRLAVFQLDDMEQQLTISATEIVIAGKLEKLVSLQNIQSELDGAQLQAWQDLVRVLTHEIMNSITPVASLAKTATELVDDAILKLGEHPEVSEELEDVKSAVETVARRSEGLMQFVQSYRRLTRLPAPKQQRILLSELFANVGQLVAAEWAEKEIELSLRVEPSSLELTADPDMVEQVLLNLLQNAQHVLAGHDSARVKLVGSLSRQGHVSVEVSDNGPGVSADIAKRIFVPFFTTRREGSGVGLALTRQVMLAHGGTATLGTSDSGGAKFTLRFLANRA
jgi:nitrogen fixation/metabolism regulation signal transduction histidine kinase